MTEVLNNYINDIVNLNIENYYVYSQVITQLYKDDMLCPKKLLMLTFNKFSFIEKLKITCMVPEKVYKLLLNAENKDDEIIKTIRHTHLSYRVMAVLLGVPIENIHNDDKLKFSTLEELLNHVKADMIAEKLNYNPYVKYIFYKYGLFKIEELDKLNIRVADELFEYIETNYPGIVEQVLNWKTQNAN